MITKHEITFSIRRLRSQLPTTFITSASHEIRKHLYHYITDAQHILMYMETQGEVVVSELAKEFPDKHFYIPKVVGKRAMKINLYEPSELVKSRMGIWESRATQYTCASVLDLVLTPGVAFDIKKNRLGYGGGFYDTFFAQHVHTEVLKIALCYDFQILNYVPTQAHDIPMNIVCSEKRVIE